MKSIWNWFKSDDGTRPDPRPSGPTRTVAAADSSPIIRKTLALTFPAPAYRLVCFSDGQQLAAQLASIKPDIVLLDSKLAGDGYLICSRIARDTRCPNVPVLLMTAPFERIDESQVTAAGARDYVPKPFDSNDLRRKVEATIVSTREQTNTDSTQ